jgi:hypothetical protein
MKTWLETLAAVPGADCAAICVFYFSIPSCRLIRQPALAVAVHSGGVGRRQASRGVPGALRAAREAREQSALVRDRGRADARRFPHSRQKLEGAELPSCHLVCPSCTGSQSPKVSTLSEGCDGSPDFIRPFSVGSYLMTGSSTLPAGSGCGGRQ